jgi:hypothetical protein
MLCLEILKSKYDKKNKDKQESEQTSLSPEVFEKFKQRAQAKKRSHNQWLKL